MSQTSRIFVLSCALGALTLTAWAQQPRKSPHETSTGKVSAAEITVEYGRPYKKGRKIFGGLVPYGKVWRTGADEATTFTTTANLKVGDIEVPAGTYSLFTIPAEDQWTLILNKTAEQWGAFDYDKAQDLGRTKMTVSTLDEPVEQLAIDVKPDALVIRWDRTAASVPITTQ